MKPCTELLSRISSDKQQTPAELILSSMKPINRWWKITIEHLNTAEPHHHNILKPCIHSHIAQVESN